MRMPGTALCECQWQTRLLDAPADGMSAVLMSHAMFASFPQAPYGQSSTCVWSASLSSLTYTYAPNNAQVMQYNDVRSVDGGNSYARTNPVINSIYLYTYFSVAVTACFADQERTACQMLANMCVLQKYHQSSTACQAFTGRTQLVNTFEHGFSPLLNGPDGWRTSLPFLYQSVNTLFATSQLLFQSVTLTDTSTVDNSQTGRLKFHLMSYTFNGTFLGSSLLSSQLQLCGGDTKLLSHFLRFGTNYENACQLDLTSFLTPAASPATAERNTVFYELFIQDLNNQLYPLPVKVLNLRLGDGSTPNLNDQGDEKIADTNVLTRRFYLVDSLAGKTTFGSAPAVVSYARKLTLRVEMHGDSSSEIRPPVLVISYGERESSDILDGAGKQYSKVSFETVYTKDPAGFRRASLGLFITALVLALVVVSVVFGTQLETKCVRKRVRGAKQTC